MKIKEATERLLTGLDVAFPAESTMAAFGVGFLWLASGYQWQVAAVGAPLVAVVRLAVGASRD